MNNTPLRLKQIKNLQSYSLKFLKLKDYEAAEILNDCLEKLIKSELKSSN